MTEHAQAIQPEREPGESKRIILGWAGLALGPAAWFLNHAGGFALSPLACAAAGKHWLLLLAGFCVLLTLGAFWLSWRSRQHLEAEPEKTAEHDRARALAGIAVSGLSLLVIVVQTIPIVMMAGCE
jgi:hypothetical protein